MTKNNVLNTSRFYEAGVWKFSKFCKEQNRVVIDEYRGIRRSETRFNCFIARKYQNYIYK
jgi:hypothetical protein